MLPPALSVVADSNRNLVALVHERIYIVQSFKNILTLIFKFCQGRWKESCQHNRDYVFKDGKWKNAEKETTNHADSHYEFGEMPVERQGRRNDLDDLYDMIRAGMSDAQILEDSPTYMVQLDSIRKTREILLAEKYAASKRELEVVYIYGAAGSGKTRSVFDEYGRDAYFVSDYDHPFDEYMGQGVMVFDEFRSSIKMSSMLRFLDIYPLVLPARYANRQACYEKVFIISNIPLWRQYEWYQKNEAETWRAFVRRIHRVRIHEKGKVIEKETREYLDSFQPCVCERVPFHTSQLK